MKPRYEQDYYRILSNVYDAGSRGITRTTLHNRARRYGLDSKGLQRVIDRLKKDEFIEETLAWLPRGGRQRTIYYITPAGQKDFSAYVKATQKAVERAV